MLLYIVQRDDDIHSTHIPESILMNVAGHLLMFQRDWSGPQPKNAPNKYKAVSIVAVLIVWLVLALRLQAIVLTSVARYYQRHQKSHSM